MSFPQAMVAAAWACLVLPFLMIPVGRLCQKPEAVNGPGMGDFPLMDSSGSALPDASGPALPELKLGESPIPAEQVVGAWNVNGGMFQKYG